MEGPETRGSAASGNRDDMRLESVTPRGGGGGHQRQQSSTSGISIPSIDGETQLLGVSSLAT